MIATDQASTQQNLLLVRNSSDFGSHELFGVSLISAVTLESTVLQLIEL
jgi:hypothetical protein